MLAPPGRSVVAVFEPEGWEFLGSNGERRYVVGKDGTFEAEDRHVLRLQDEGCHVVITPHQF